MRALQIVEPSKLALRDDLPEPEPGNGEVLVRCRYVSICGSNIHPYLGEGRWARTEYPKPAAWDGHECIGTIVESRLAGWEAGTTVLAHPEDYLGFAELIRARPPGLVRLPQEADLAPLIAAQPLATVLRAFARLGPVAGQRCAVVGQGPMGLIFTALLRRMGARQVIGIDLLAWRLECARRLGATAVVDASREDVTERVRELTEGQRVDLGVEAVGFAETARTAVLLPRRQGTVMLFGVPRYDPVEFPVEHFFRNELSMLSSVGEECVDYFATAVGMLVEGHLDLEPLITHRLPWDEAPRAFELYAGHARGVLKIVLEVGTAG
ncbi:MAG: zinc-dependent alcohol dehydrogenase [Candidatus Brocadiia bacterium]